MEFNKFFDKSYCINLKRREDRWQRSKQNFDKLKLKVERFEALDAKTLDENIGTPKERGRYACTESHYNVIKAARDLDLDSVAIFEDDCVFQDNFNDVVGEYLALIPFNWQMIMIGYYIGKNFPLNKFEGEKIIKIPENLTKHDGLWATHAYAVAKSLYNDILESPNGAFTENGHDSVGGYGCIDITYFYKFHGKYDFYAINPSLVDQEKNDSDIIV